MNSLQRAFAARAAAATAAGAADDDDPSAVPVPAPVAMAIASVSAAAAPAPAATSPLRTPAPARGPGPAAACSIERYRNSPELFAILQEQEPVHEAGGAQRTGTPGQARATPQAGHAQQSAGFSVGPFVGPVRSGADDVMKTPATVSVSSSSSASAFSSSSSSSMYASPSVGFISPAVWSPYCSSNATLYAPGFDAGFGSGSGDALTQQQQQQRQQESLRGSTLRLAFLHGRLRPLKNNAKKDESNTTSNSESLEHSTAAAAAAAEAAAAAAPATAAVTVAAADQQSSDALDRSVIELSDSDSEASVGGEGPSKSMSTDGDDIARTGSASGDLRVLTVSPICLVSPAPAAAKTVAWTTPHSGGDGDGDGGSSSRPGQTQSSS